MKELLDEAARHLQEVPGLDVLLQVPLAGHTSFHIGGPADLFLLPHTVEALSRAQRLLTESGVPRVFLGRGTNVLVSDEGVRGAVVKLAGGLVGIEQQGRHLLAGAGEDLGAVCHFAAEQGLSGMEFSAGIPGTLGGAILMNAGANGGEMADVVQWAEVVDAEGQVQRFEASELGFGYRLCSLRGAELAVSRVGLRLTPADRASVHERVCAIIEQRCARQPVAQASAGCIFKRPQGDYAGRLVEAVQGKGLRVGDAVISEKHANFIVNLGKAQARDVTVLIRMVRCGVRERFGVELEPEVCLLGEHDPL